jgi:hypothetical protein
MKTTTTTFRVHEIAGDRINAFGKRIITVDCIYQEKTLVVEYGNAGPHETLCGCGIRL